jgi:hypothetical protein
MRKGFGINPLFLFDRNRKERWQQGIDSAKGDQ